MLYTYYRRKDLPRKAIEKIPIINLIILGQLMGLGLT
jgi:hypothetical protein